MKTRYKFALCIAVLAAVAGYVVAKDIHESVPAAPSEIAAALDGASTECRELTRARLREAIIRNGTISRRQVAVLSKAECALAGPQYLATTERTAGSARPSD